MTERSLGSKIKMISGLHESDLSDWESEFAQNIFERTNDGDQTSGLSEKQIEAIERIWGKHFA